MAREMKRLARVGDWIKIVSDQTAIDNSYKVGDIYQVTKTKFNGRYAYVNEKFKHGEPMFFVQSDYVVLEGYDVERKILGPDSKEVMIPLGSIAEEKVSDTSLLLRIKGLENRIKTLETLVGVQCKSTLEEILPFGEPVRPKWTRKQVIEQAMRDIEILLKHEHEYVRVTHSRYDDWGYTPEDTRNTWLVDREKRTVTVMLIWRGTEYASATARCFPDDVFNETIGKAVALHHLFGLEVPEIYKETPQPTELAVGQIVKLFDKYKRFVDQGTVETIQPSFVVTTPVKITMRGANLKRYTSESTNFKIIDDSLVYLTKMK